MKPASRRGRRGLGVLACLATMAPVLAVTQSVGSAAPPASAVLAPPASGAFVPDAPVAVEITTVDAAPILNRKDYVPGSMVLDGTTYQLGIRGRGNSTWGWPKKPYKIKLEEDASLLGMPSDNEWVLLANYADRTSLRTHLAMTLGSMTQSGWTPRTRFVDVTLNGLDLGLYVLTEQVEQGDNRVALPDGSYLLEIDKRFREHGEAGFWSNRRTPVSFKDPDELEYEQRLQVRKAVNHLEDVLFGNELSDPVNGYAPLVDVRSFIDWYLVEELFFNQDSNFSSSVHVTWVPGGRFAMGPLWDFDLSAGSHWQRPVPPDRYYYTRSGDHWISRMFRHPGFTIAARQRWDQIRPLVDEMIASIPAAAAAIRPSLEKNWQIWPDATATALAGSIHADTINGELDYMQDWLTARANWMSSDEAFFGRAAPKVAERSRVVKVPVRILGPRTETAEVRYFRKAGSAIPGVDFRMQDGTLKFAPGETVKHIRVRIFDDRRREGNERIRIKLAPGTTATRIGDPDVIVVTIKQSDALRR